jgi:hypothetical protein
MMPLGDQVQRCFDPFDHQGVACVVPALEPNHALRRLGQPVHQFAFAFVAPLGSDNHHIATLGSIHEIENSQG